MSSTATTTVVVLSKQQYEALEKQLKVDYRAALTYPNNPSAVAHHAGMIAVLEALRKGFVTEV